MQPCSKNSPRFISYENRVSLTGYLAVLLLLIGIILAGCDSLIDTGEDAEEEVERIYSKSIEREYDNKFERALIDSAEAVYPKRDSVVADLNTMYPHLREWDEFISETNYWYWFNNDGVLLPYSLTIDAITYYSNLVDSLKAKSSSQSIKTADFEYNSSIKFYEHYEFYWPEEWPPPRENDLPTYEFDMVYVVDLSMKWHHECIQKCLMTIKHKRIVVFDEAGNIKRIFLDGPWPAVTT